MPSLTVSVSFRFATRPLCFRNAARLPIAISFASEREEATARRVGPLIPGSLVMFGKSRLTTVYPQRYVELIAWKSSALGSLPLYHHRIYPSFRTASIFSRTDMTRVYSALEE